MRIGVSIPHLLSLLIPSPVQKIRRTRELVREKIRQLLHSLTPYSFQSLNQLLSFLPFPFKFSLSLSLSNTVCLFSSSLRFEVRKIKDGHDNNMVVVLSYSKVERKKKKPRGCKRCQCQCGQYAHFQCTIRIEDKW